MAQQMSAKVAAMHMTVCNALEDLRPMFKGAVHLTFIARFEDDPTGSADVLITDDDFAELLKLIERRKLDAMYDAMDKKG